MTALGAWTPEPGRERRAWSLRALLLAGWFLFSALPAASVCWLLYTSNLQSVQILSDRVVNDLARRVQSSAEDHVAQAHTVLNGLAEEVASDVGVETLARDSGSLMRVGTQRQVGEGLANFLADIPGDRRTMLPGEAQRYEPRERVWYQAAIAQKGRLFTGRC